MAHGLLSVTYKCPFLRRTRCIHYFSYSNLSQLGPIFERLETLVLWLTRYSPMAFQNCPFSCCSPSMLLDRIHGHGDMPHDPPSMSTALRQEIEWPSFDSPLHDLSLSTVHAPAASWVQGPYTNSQYNHNSFDTRNHQSLVNIAQPTHHQAVHPPPLTAFDTRSSQEQTWGHYLAVSIEEKSEDRQGSAVPGKETLKCRWKDCQYTGTFGRKTDLMRHLETQHVSTKAYKCSFPGCGRRFNRDDNLQGHLRKVHGHYRQYR